jgi:[acyl-carrier-protein] S-malonyltransferase
MNKKKTAFLFPGQGAQYPGMGKDFYDAFAAARQTFEEANDLLKENFSKLIFEGSSSDLTITRNSQLAIYITSVAMLRSLPLKPDLCAGLSLGEYTALFASDRISFEEGLFLVRARGAYMQEACEMTAGTMRVVLGLEEEKVAAVLPSNVWIANLNCPGQVVIAGETAMMGRAEEALKAAGAKRVLPLEVSGAFHTPLMRSAQEQLKPLILAAKIQESSVDFVMNVPGDYVKIAEEIRQNLIAQVASPTRWEKGIRAMRDVDTFIEIGPGKTLTGMNKKMGISGMSIEKVTDVEAVYATAT